MANQQGDILLYQTADDGEINVSNGVVEMSGGLQTAVYLSLFGGNEDDDGLESNARNWWGNFDETETSRRYRSETQNLLQSIPLTSGNLLKVRDAVRRDLNWLLEEQVASSIGITVSIPGLNKIAIAVDISAVGAESRFEFIENWNARS